MPGKDKMLSPQDIKNKTFTRSVRGYNVDEVDKYIDFLCEKYETLYRENGELTFKLNAMTEGVRSPDRKKEEEIREAILIAKSKADDMISEAEQRADAIYRSAQENADKVLKQFREDIVKEAMLLDYLKKHTEALKKEVIEIYKGAIAETESIAPAEKYKGSTDIDLLVKTVLDSMKADVAENEEINTSVKKPADKKSKPTAVRSESGKFKGVSMRDTIKEINRRIISDDAGLDEPGELVTNLQTEKVDK